MVWLCGVDGFKEKWRAVLGNFATGEVRLMDLPLNEILDLPERPAIITVDIPIGLPEVTLPGGRICDRRARRLLGSRHESIFSPIGRMCLQTNNREQASQLSIDRGGIGIGVQSWGLAKKLLEIDRLMTPAKQRIVREVLPEVSFCEMNGGEPLIQSKKTTDGERQRVSALKRGSFPESFLSPLGTLRSGRDDFLDACAALWTAERIYRGTAKRRTVAPDLMPLFEAYESNLAESGFTDWAGVLTTATDALLNDSFTNPLLGLPTILLDIALTSEAELSLVHALSLRTPELIVIAPSADERTLSLALSRS